MARRRSSMDAAQARLILGVERGAEWETVRVAYRTLIRLHHPDRAGAASADDAARINEAFRVLDHVRTHPEDDVDEPPRPTTTRRGPTHVDADVSDLATEAWRRHRYRPPEGLAPAVYRADGDTLLMAAPADETFRWLLDAAHDIGEVTYVDGSVPIIEVLCRFEGEPATSLLLTLQGRVNGTEVFCTIESIEDRPAPPVEAVVDLLELALHRRTHPEPD